MRKGSWIEFDSKNFNVDDIELDFDTHQKRKLRIYKTKSGRGGKIVTLIEGLVINDEELRKLVKKLRSFCGAGGSLKNGKLEIQGDQVSKISDYMKNLGYKI